MSDFPDESYEKDIRSPTREAYRKQKEQLREGRRKIEEMEKREKNLSKMFSSLFYGNDDEKNVKKIDDAFSNYTLSEREELYTKMQYISPWKDEETKSIFRGATVRETLTFLIIYVVTDVIAMVFLSFFVWNLMGNFTYVLYSAAVSGGLLSIMLVIKGVIKLVRKKKEKPE